MKAILKGKIRRTTPSRDAIGGRFFDISGISAA